ncbi:MAG TPA: SgcJ/EcaC family oxidoreductase, partial [Pyrinomonadaceae bacterium]|nr:SgcJ/EcaC family oxidoreductase [Pyrinomonadaceae bacterium]
LVDTWLKASESGDVNTILTLMADDVIFMVPGREPFGKAEFVQNYKQMSGVKLTTKSNIQEIKVLGEWAWMRNLLRVTFTPGDGSPTTHSGYVLTILRKTSDGRWVITRDANLLTPQ